MNRGFARTVHGLGSERRLSALGLLFVGLLLAGWLVWLFVARISVFEVTHESRIAADRATYPIEARVDGRVAAISASVGQRIRSGDVLVQLDTEEFSIRLRDEEGQRAALEEEIAAAREELELRRLGEQESRQAAASALAAARSRSREAEITADFARREAERAEVLHRDGQVSRVQMERLGSAAERFAAGARTQQLAVEEDEAAERARALEERTEIAQLRGALARLEGEARSAAARAEGIRLEIEKRAVRAPRDGEIGEWKELTVAALVEEGERLGTVLAAGELEIIAEFAPTSALGRVRVGQRAQMRLDGFPWTQYGTLAASVKEVAAEPRDERLRVELRVDPESASRLPVRHGLTGTVEVEVERISPALLLLRTLGKTIDPQPVAAAAAP